MMSTDPNALLTECLSEATSVFQATDRGETPAVTATIKRKYTEENPKGWALKSTLHHPAHGEIPESWEEIETIMCDFVATILEEVQLHQGEDAPKTIYYIGGITCQGIVLRTLEVEAETFQKMEWLAGWGAEISTNQAWPKGKGSVTGNIREAIVERKKVFPPSTKEVYDHLGWVKIKDKYVYLHAKGGIGEDGQHLDICVDMDRSALNKYVLPEPTDQLAEAIKTSLRILDLTDDQTAVPMLLATYRAAIPVRASFAVHDCGPTGGGKSTFTALLQGHYDPTSRHDSLAGSWIGTAASLEKIAHMAKDALLCVDDANQSVADINKKMERVLRAQGNGTGRSRMTAEMKSQRSFPPRSLIISTGEDLPEGHSCRARVLLVESHSIISTDGNNDLLDYLQGQVAAGTMAESMAGWVQWMAPKIDAIKEQWNNSLIQMRKSLATGVLEAHGRSVDAISELLMTGQMLLAYAEERGAISPEELNAYMLRFNLAFNSIAQNQKVEQKAEDPSYKFLLMLPDILAAGLCHITDIRGDAPEEWKTCEMFGFKLVQGYNGATQTPQGPCIGKFSEGRIYFNKTVAFALVTDYAKRTGSFFGVSTSTFWRNLKTCLLDGDGKHLGVKMNLLLREGFDSSYAPCVSIRDFPAWSDYAETPKTVAKPSQMMRHGGQYDDVTPSAPPQIMPPPIPIPKINLENFK
jgi:hypothetical protein